MVTTNGHLQLADLDHEKGKRVAVDIFFRSLAATHGPHAAAIVLSGADGDGAIGIKRIKERGGLTVAQDPEEAEHGSMLRSSVETGMVDWVLPIKQMPERLISYFGRKNRSSSRRRTARNLFKWPNLPTTSTRQHCGMFCFFFGRAQVVTLPTTSVPPSCAVLGGGPPTFFAHHGDALDAKSYPGTVDFITCTGLAEFLDDAQLAKLYGIFRKVLKPGGKLFTSGMRRLPLSTIC